MELQASLELGIVRKGERRRQERPQGNLLIYCLKDVGHLGKA